MSKKIIDSFNDTTNTSTETNTISKSNSETTNKTIDSFNTKTSTETTNKDVGNTSTETTTKDVGNTSTETTTKYDDSFNTKTSTETTTKYDDSYNTTNETTTKTIDSNNTTTTDIGLQLKGLFNDYNNHEGSTVFLPADVTQQINGAAGDASTMIAMDQVNSLAANNEANNDQVYNTGSGIFDHDHLGGNDATGLDKSDGSSIGSSVSGAANATVTTDAHSAIDAFTQSIVLGANTQLNSFAVTVVGHDTIANADHH